MDLMLEALKQIDDQSSAPPVTLILPLSDSAPNDGGDRQAARRESKAARGRKPSGPVVERFAFPELPEAIADAALPATPILTWPECDVAETVYACAEAARNILRHLSLDRPRMVLFTSPDDGDGKTGLLLGLVPELAKRTTGSVLVVDANFRNPDLTAQLHVPTDKMRDQTTLIYPTNLPRLSVLPAPAAERVRGGRCDAAPAASARRSPQKPPSAGFDPSTSDELREGWSLVLVDTPSLVHAEVAPMVQRCDGVYLVVRLGYTARRTVSEAARVIRAHGGRLLGCMAVG